MTPPPIHANIVEPNGDYWPTKLHAIPRPGDLIKLTSLIDLRKDLLSLHHFEVIKVMHEVTDSDPDAPDGRETAAQSVVVFVKPAESKLFEGNIAPSSGTRN